MKKISIRIFLICMIVTSFHSCSEKIDDAYANPNAPVRVAPETLLPNIIAAMVANAAGHGPMNDARYIGAYIQNWHFWTTLSPYDQMGYINNVADVSQSTWRSHYYDIGQNNVKMIEWATEEKKWDYVGVGKAIFAWSWLTLTDYYGEVILKEAFRTELLTFKFDTQEDVYEYVRTLCFESLDYLNRTGDAVSQANLALGDKYMYNGDTQKWKKFVYGILARYHNHLSNKANYKADSVIYYANLSILNNADNAMVKFEGTVQGATNNFMGPRRNNLSGVAATNPTAIRQGLYIANLMNGTNSRFLGVEDPRAWYMLRGNANGTIKGVTLNKGQLGITVANDRPENFWGVKQAVSNNTQPANDDSARYIFKNTVPLPVLTASEIHFMKAEAAFRKGNKDEALTSYKDGISANFDLLTTTYNASIPAGKEITPAVKTAFLQNPKVVPLSVADFTLSMIMLQKYIALFGHGVLETWGDMRRYHYIDPDPSGTGQVYADFLPPAGADLFSDNGGGINYVYRVRPRYNSEYVWNIVELQRIGATTNNYHTKRMWFTEP